MKYIVVVFSSRNDTMQFYKIIRNYGLFCTIINTPRVLATSCGVSAKIDSRLIQNAISIIRKNKFSTFKGIYMIEVFRNGENASRLY